MKTTTKKKTDFTDEKPIEEKPTIEEKTALPSNSSSRANEINKGRTREELDAEFSIAMKAARNLPESIDKE